MELGVHGEVRALTGIRGVAVLGILLAACTGPFAALGLTDLPLLGAALRNGTLGFDLMFVLSGLILTRNHLWLGSTFSASVVLRFWGIRLARLYPVYLLVLAISIGWNLLGGYGAGLSALEVVRSVLLVQAWGDVPTALALTWSISVIWFAYLAFPLMCLLLHPLRRQPYALFAIWLVVMAAVMIVCRDSSVSGWPALLRGVGEFVVGAVTYCLVTAVSTRGSLRRWTRASRAIGAFALLVLIIGFFTVSEPIYLLPAVVILLGALLRSRQGVASLFASTPVVAIGSIAFAAYMVHGLVINLCDLAARTWGATGAILWIGIAVIIVGSFAVGALVWRWFETPVRRLLTARLRGSADNQLQIAEQ